MSQYLVRRAVAAVPLDAEPSHPVWAAAEVACVSCFHSSSSVHRPVTQARVLHDERNLYLQFDVQDQYVRAVETEYQAAVCQDSCVEFFVQPKAGKGYFNFEFNCAGTMLLMYIEDPTVVGDRLRRFCAVWPEHARQVRIRSTVASPIHKEIAEPTRWRLSVCVPVSVFEPYVGPVLPINGHPWRANFYKCADKSSHPHWASWSPINGYLNFHQPQYFGALSFEP
ncbi:MAG TPA: carbohydrate-binding family 9-like protein [Tepidisphaeraceae bacterium]